MSGSLICVCSKITILFGTNGSTRQTLRRGLASRPTFGDLGCSLKLWWLRPCHEEYCGSKPACASIIVFTSARNRTSFGALQCLLWVDFLNQDCGCALDLESMLLAYPAKVPFSTASVRSRETRTEQNWSAVLQIVLQNYFRCQNEQY